LDLYLIHEMQSLQILGTLSPVAVAESWQRQHSVGWIRVSRTTQSHPQRILPPGVGPRRWQFHLHRHKTSAQPRSSQWLGDSI